jgi:hypothetical protein
VNKPGAVAYACNSSYSRDKDQENCGSKLPEANVSKTSSQSISQAWWYVLMISAMQEAVDKRTEI